jgi:hypothetical protein
MAVAALTRIQALNGTVALIDRVASFSSRCICSTGFERLSDEVDFAMDARLLVVDVSAFDGSDSLDPAQGCFGRSQGPKALPVSQEPCQRSMVAFD